MIVHQFYDKGLAHASYAIIRTGRMIVIDPARNPQPYYDFAALHHADITGVIETHPHADFVSSHLEIHQTTGAVIYVSKLAGAAYPHETFDDGDFIQLNDIKLKAINTPGHSPDSICVLLEDETGRHCAVFTGDTLFAGDVGRPDLRENAGNITAKKEELARQMYHSTRDKLMVLPADVTVYPAHGPGSLCGKSMSPDLQTTIGKELRDNYALQLMNELDFVKVLTADQPFMPKYFGYDVEMNKNGAPNFEESIGMVNRPSAGIIFEKDALIIDTRIKEAYRNGHVNHSINLQDGEKFETWLGSVIGPDEPFYLIAATDEELEIIIKKTAKIGYEQNITAAILTPVNATERSPNIDYADFKAHTNHYTIIDVRNWAEIKSGKIFSNSLTIPLPELRERVGEIPADKPIIVHCAAGYRSAAAVGIIASAINNVPVYDLSDAINEWK
ncbi:MBL fold metallo-hydrolase [Mucilaginibacter phyllosphaerae]|uniref:Glyoxylase-like metal-dependent hydrolase (Beta-lactamase superfamily II)/rhodanese-related sulfurtransferase n=1 Tax=Mucilaginibacter phyllosphaerae TaxID=1812349 RepID=A0A4Y8AGT1_9SPHI|nr:MBL fold metallo-hydrolase [Mucilaginibacter phyllosphaerae]MBB3968408.1 glyoxylase-like metal-dependent hydrolase (beta-lactamase superfamily II)/rhodanese-related sulfurtransferase [Mucilaginibacter phyllosphaerae]TEW67944.1 MBL fold metallo-hydrolase [Mucilaginibacter phyllosphaerae]GGH16184.1 MBL fold metallo-hydrolase [Mucilaginibacter phyllosphaerae]